MRAVGAAEGNAVGAVGGRDGAGVGASVGLVGEPVGLGVGFAVGASVDGTNMYSYQGDRVGAGVGPPMHLPFATPLQLLVVQSVSARQSAPVRCTGPAAVVFGPQGSG